MSRRTLLSGAALVGTGVAEPGTYQPVPWPLLGSVTAMTHKPERTAVEQLWRSVVLGMTLVVLLTVVVVLAAS